VVWLAFVVTAALALLAGCETLTVDNPFKPPPISVRLDESTTAPVSVARGQTLVVALDANVTTGYRWEATPGFAPTLSLTGTPDLSVQSAVQGQVVPPGAPGVMTFRFLAAAAGTTTLELAYRRPFEPNVAAAKTVRYDVTVR
jgi:inhibitor of cysteine peptidase